MGHRIAVSLYSEGTKKMFFLIYILFWNSYIFHISGFQVYTVDGLNGTLLTEVKKMQK